MTDRWTIRPERAADVTGVRDVIVAAFPSPDEADLVEALRADPTAWIDGLSYIAEQTRAEQTRAEQTRAEQTRGAPPRGEPKAVDRAEGVERLGGVERPGGVDREGRVVGHALLTRCHVDGADSLALAPCSVLPDHQRTGVGTAVIAAVLDEARRRGEQSVIVLGHADYYPRFGFVPASRFGVTAGFEVPDEAFMAMPLSDAARVPAGTVEYPSAFGV